MIRDAYLSGSVADIAAVPQVPIKEQRLVQLLSEPVTLYPDDLHMIELLRSGDEEAFEALVACYQAPMLRLATMYVKGYAVAEEVVQETWMGILQGLHNFEGRSSLKTWMFRILINRAKTRAKREERYIQFSSLSELESTPAETTIEPERFLSIENREAGQWISFSAGWQAVPEEYILSQEISSRIDEAIEALPSSQRAVINLRDKEGWMAEETCHLLGISEVNQRVLLHRARSRVRADLERYFGEE